MAITYKDLRKMKLKQGDEINMDLEDGTSKTVFF